MTYSEAIIQLKAAGIEEPEWDAALLLEHFCKADRSTLSLFPNRDYCSPEFLEAMKKRLGRIPLQYIIGEWPFYRQTYRITPDCLIPRQDTELLVERAIELLPPNAFFMDLCTGSGCIAVSILSERKDTRALATDISSKALDLARFNAERNGVSDRLFLQRSDVKKMEWNGEKPIAILSNPPYIRSADIKTLSPEVRKEPVIALDGGEDGMDFYRSLLGFAERYLETTGFCLFEIGYDEAPLIKQLANTHGLSCKILRDYAGNDRAAELVR